MGIHTFTFTRFHGRYPQVYNITLYMSRSIDDAFIVVVKVIDWYKIVLYNIIPNMRNNIARFVETVSGA